VRALIWFYAVNTWATGPCLKHNEGCQYIARDPKNVRQRLESRMTPEQIAKASDEAREWLRTWEAKHRRQWTVLHGAGRHKGPGIPLQIHANRYVLIAWQAFGLGRRRRSRAGVLRRYGTA
jgi:hypothetical protein